jgi:hypothetical protein
MIPLTFWTKISFDEGRIETKHNKDYYLYEIVCWESRSVSAWGESVDYTIILTDKLRKLK